MSKGWIQRSKVLKTETVFDHLFLFFILFFFLGGGDGPKFSFLAQFLPFFGQSLFFFIQVHFPNNFFFLSLKSFELFEVFYNFKF